MPLGEHGAVQICIWFTLPNSVCSLACICTFLHACLWLAISSRGFEQALPVLAIQRSTRVYSSMSLNKSRDMLFVFTV